MNLVLRYVIPDSAGPGSAEVAAEAKFEEEDFGYLDGEVVETEVLDVTAQPCEIEEDAQMSLNFDNPESEETED